MGCTNSKLQGDAFDSIDASKHAAHEKELSISRNSAIDDKFTTEITQTDGVQETAFTHPAIPKLDRPVYMEESPGIQSTTVPSAQESRPYPKGTTTSFDRANPPNENGKPKKLSLYQRYTNARLGVGEPRDPVTGKGLYTGMTKEEVKEHVYTTRQAGVYGNGDVFGKKLADGRRSQPIDTTGMAMAFLAA